MVEAEGRIGKTEGVRRRRRRMGNSYEGGPITKLHQGRHGGGNGDSYGQIHLKDITSDYHLMNIIKIC